MKKCFEQITKSQVLLVVARQEYFRREIIKGGGRCSEKRTAMGERRKVQLFEYLYWKPRFKRDQAELFTTKIVVALSLLINLFLILAHAVPSFLFLSGSD